MTTVRRDLAVRLARHGRSRSSMITLANIRRRVVVPWAPTMGNMLLASEAPDWMDAMAINSRPTGNNADARLRGGVVIGVFVQSRGGEAGAYDAQPVSFEQYIAQLLVFGRLYRRCD